MNLFDSLQNKLLDQVSLKYPEATQVLKSLFSQYGGVSGVIAAFKEKGLGELVSSWISTGQNLPISTEQLQGFLGNDTVKQLASTLGLDSGTLLQKTSAQLPELVNELTTDGKLPDIAGLQNQALEGLKNLFGSH